MTLFDTDKNSLNRGSPIPNRPDVVSPDSVKAHGTTSVNYLTDASDASLLTDGKTGLMTTVQSDILTLNNSVTLNNSPGAGTFASFRAVVILSVEHNLPFTPLVTGSLLSPSGLTYRQMPHGDSDYNSLTTSALWDSITFSADDTYIYVDASGMVWGGGWNLAPGWSFKYFAQYQTSN